VDVKVEHPVGNKPLKNNWFAANVKNSHKQQISKAREMGKAQIKNKRSRNTVINFLDPGSGSQ
jgi:hypothetical protein